MPELAWFLKKFMYPVHYNLKQFNELNCPYMRQDKEKSKGALVTVGHSCYKVL